MRIGVFIMGIELGIDAVRSVVGVGIPGGLAIDPSGATPVLAGAKGTPLASRPGFGQSWLTLTM
ncbi:hypothetical protein ACMHYB_24395 [Sorangium sp. So ce1128]